QDLRAPSGASSTSPLVGYGTISASSASGLYRFQTPATLSSAGANIVLKAWGTGLTPPTLTVYNSAGVVVARAAATDASGGFLSLHLDALAANSSYYVQV